MNTYKVKALAYFLLGVGLINFSFLDKPWNHALFILGTISFVAAFILIISLKIKWGWISVSAKHINAIYITHITIFLALIGLGLGLLQAQVVLPGLLLILVAYVLYGSMIGWQLGRGFLRPAFDKLNIFQPSVEIPKEFRDEEWKL